MVARLSCSVLSCFFSASVGCAVAVASLFFRYTALLAIMPAITATAAITAMMGQRLRSVGVSDGIVTVDIFYSSNSGLANEYR